MSKIVKEASGSRSSTRDKTPNAMTREAIEAVRRGDVESAKDVADLLKKLKS